ncbi:MAG: hypothetical protein SOR58_08900 [Megasphaera massiliensis]|jgi:hypothetical protein|uniref:hypothetical protein n=1 Tax=Megasphaera TaxID=906 RepID=UPI00258F191A|nr:MULTISPECIES: hypothetical protein [Megasphaera]MDY2966302.1 hypothetical protein [Megasphaera massiliensis]
MNFIETIVGSLIKAHYQYLSEQEAHHTEMERQIADIKVRTAVLQANTELAQKYFQYQIEERERLFKSASAVLQKAIDNGNSECAEIAVKTLEIICRKSPFSF